MKTVLITGSEGNIGQYVVERFAEKWPDVTVIRVGFAPQEKKEGNLYLGDLADASFVAKIFAENAIDYVIHLAAKNYSPDSFGKDAFGVFSNDVKILLNVLANSGKVKKFVYFSSAMVYESSKQTPFTEELTESILPPQSPLGLSKWVGEKAVRFFGQQSGVPYTIWRPFNVVSPLESHQKPGHVFVDFYRKLFVEKAPQLEIFGNGQQVRCFTWVEDLAECVVDFLADEKTDNQIFNIGGNEPKTLLDLANLFMTFAKYKPEIITGGESAITNIQQRIPSTQKLKNILGFECKTGFEECFEKFIATKNENT